MLKFSTLLIVLATVGCGGSQEVVMPANPTALPTEVMMEAGGGGDESATTDSTTPPPLSTPGQ